MGTRGKAASGRWSAGREPGCAVDQLRTLVRPCPGAHRLAPEEGADRCDRTDGVKDALVVPGAAAGVGDSLREREEELDVALDATPVHAVVVPTRDELREEVPVPGRKLRVRTVGPILGDHLLLVGETGADVEERLSLSEIVGRSVL